MAVDTTKFLNIGLRKLYFGNAEVREDVYKMALEKKKGFSLEFQKDIMIVPAEHVKYAHKTDRKVLGGRTGQRYYLYQYPWIPLKEKVVTNIQPDLWS